MTYDPLAALRHYIYRNYPSPIHEEMSTEESLMALSRATERMLESSKGIHAGQVLPLDVTIVNLEVSMDRIRGATFLQRRGYQDEEIDWMLESSGDETDEITALMMRPRPADTPYDPIKSLRQYIRTNYVSSITEEMSDKEIFMALHEMTRQLLLSRKDLIPNHLVPLHIYIMSMETMIDRQKGKAILQGRGYENVDTGEDVIGMEELEEDNQGW